jgi:hypothetical protein
MEVRLQHHWPPRCQARHYLGEAATAQTGVDDSYIAIPFDQKCRDDLPLIRFLNHGHAVRKSPDLEPTRGGHPERSSLVRAAGERAVSWLNPALR